MDFAQHQNDLRAQRRANRVLSAIVAALRNFGPVLFYLGMAIFGAVGLTIAGAILGAVI